MPGMAPQTGVAQLREAGYVLLRDALKADACQALATAFPDAPARAGGLRNAWPLVNASARGTLDALAETLLQAPAHAVRAILFDKTPQSNWTVPWHQDLSIPVRERHDVEGFGRWSLKEGIWHAQPPAAVLEGMLTLRLHLDDCDDDNAPLQVLSGSHLQGRLDEARYAALLRGRAAIVCTAKAGDVLAMRPLLLHASAKAARPARRRVLHVEYAGGALPAPLRWQAA
jgi:ectoine hydroxylase-related dioxygenase (phytanoyl-CoA dioxygenase family)